jgi:hypothetical protein
MAELLLDDIEQGRAVLVPPAASDAVAPRPADDDTELPQPR